VVLERKMRDGPRATRWASSRVTRCRRGRRTGPARMFRAPRPARVGAGCEGVSAGESGERSS
jgi:hypothetical protein